MIYIDEHGKEWAQVAENEQEFFLVPVVGRMLKGDDFSWWLLILIVLGSMYFGAYIGIRGYKVQMEEEISKVLYKYRKH